MAMNALNVGRIKLGAGVLDSMRNITSLSTKYATERK
jgi:alkylation response protein AidB-like acyl-CoA dehydrogenase